MKGTVEAERSALIDKVFVMLDPQQEHELEIQHIVDSLKMKDKQEFANAVNLYCDFQSIDDGYFTDEDFIDLFEFLSVIFVENEAFRNFILHTFYEEDVRSRSSHGRREREFGKKSQQDRS